MFSRFDGVRLSVRAYGDAESIFPDFLSAWLMHIELCAARSKRRFKNRICEREVIGLAKHFVPSLTFDMRLACVVVCARSHRNFFNDRNMIHVGKSSLYLVRCFGGRMQNPPSRFLNVKRRVAILMFGVLGTLPVGAFAQQGELSPQMLAQMETVGALVNLGVNLVFLLIFGVVLLIARRNMKGWNQPLKEVWFSFSGRLNRKAYWLKGVVPLWLLGSAIQIFGTLVGMMMGNSVGAVIGGIGLAVVLLPLIVFNIWVSLALMIKRLHDLGSPGWWVLGFFIPFYNIWLAIKIAFFRGDVGTNSYGLDPIDPINDYIEETYGGGDEPEDDRDAEPTPRPQPKGPAPDETPKGFGAKKISKPTAPAQPTTEDVAEEYVPEDLPGGDANLEVIKRRLGEDIMRPIRRKGGGGREPEG